MIDFTYYCDQDSVTAILSAVGVTLRLDDDQSGSASVSEIAYLTQLRGWASQTVDMYCWDRYSPSWLAQSPLVQRWASFLACYDLCSRRGNAVPDQIQMHAEKAEDDLKEIHAGRLRIPGIPQRRVCAPTWSNTRFDPRFQFRCIRVERNTSSRIASGVPQVIDIPSQFWVEL